MAKAEPSGHDGWVGGNEPVVCRRFSGNARLREIEVGVSVARTGFAEIDLPPDTSSHIWGKRVLAFEP